MSEEIFDSFANMNGEGLLAVGLFQQVAGDFTLFQEK